MFQKEEGKWLIAVSGGPDSMALLHMCVMAGMEVEAAHVNYHQRDASDEEEQYVRMWCRENNVVCHVRNETFESAHNFESDAREWRYSFFIDLVHKRKLSGIMTAHHMDDSLETYIMQKEKGLIPSWYGIKRETFFRGVRLIRPLLSFTKKKLEQYCAENGIRYYIDQTNLEPVHTRNIIRQNISSWPMKQKEALCREIDEENRKLADTRKQASLLYEGKKLILFRYRTAEEEVRLAALRSLMDPDGTAHYSRRYMQETDQILLRHEDFLIPFGEKELVQSDGMAYVQQAGKPYAVILNDLGPRKEKYFTVSEEGSSLDRVAVEKEDFPLTVRSVQPGDTILMRFGRKKVHRFFIDRRIPRGKRNTWPVVVNAEGTIVLVPGLGCDANHWKRDHVLFVSRNAIQ